MSFALWKLVFSQPAFIHPLYDSFLSLFVGTLYFTCSSVRCIVCFHGRGQRFNYIEGLCKHRCHSNECSVRAGKDELQQSTANHQHPIYRLQSRARITRTQIARKLHAVWVVCTLLSKQTHSPHFVPTVTCDHIYVSISRPQVPTPHLISHPWEDSHPPEWTHTHTHTYRHQNRTRTAAYTGAQISAKGQDMLGPRGAPQRRRAGVHVCLLVLVLYSLATCQV